MHHAFKAADSCQSKQNALIIGTPGGVVLGHIIDILARERAKVREPIGERFVDDANTMIRILNPNEGEDLVHFDLRIDCCCHGSV